MTGSTEKIKKKYEIRYLAKRLVGEYKKADEDKHYYVIARLMEITSDLNCGQGFKKNRIYVLKKFNQDFKKGECRKRIFASLRRLKSRKKNKIVTIELTEKTRSRMNKIVKNDKYRNIKTYDDLINTLFDIRNKAHKKSKKKN